MKRIILTSAAALIVMTGCASYQQGSSGTETVSVQEQNKKPVATFAVYQDASLGYSFTYPASWKIDKKGYYTAGKEITVRSPQPSVFGTITVRLEPGTVDSVRREMSGRQMNERTVSIGNKTGYIFEVQTVAGQNTTTTGVYVESGDKLFLITATKFQQEQVQKTLNSFKF